MPHDHSCESTPLLPVAALDAALAHRIREQRSEVLAVLERWGLSNPRLFGSVARGEETPDGDIDMLVDVPAGIGLLTLGRCQAQLEDLLGAPVDLISAADLKAGVVSEVLAEAVGL